MDVNILADRWFSAIERGDLDAVRECYHPELEAWHNYDEVVQTREQNLASLKYLCRFVADLRFEAVERFEIAGGFVQRHVMTGTVRGRPLRMPACITAHVQDGQVIRFSEYLDSAHLKVLAQR